MLKGMNVCARMGKLLIHIACPTIHTQFLNFDNKDQHFANNSCSDWICLMKVSHFTKTSFFFIPTNRSHRRGSCDVFYLLFQIKIRLFTCECFWCVFFLKNFFFSDFSSATRLKIIPLAKNQWYNQFLPLLFPNRKLFVNSFRLNSILIIFYFSPEFISIFLFLLF